MECVLDHLLSASPHAAPPIDINDAWARHRIARARFANTVDAATAGGFAADRLGYAFLSGYQEAVRALVPGLPAGELVSVCATESGGAHPAAIGTTLTEHDGGWLVDGRKTFATLGTSADRLLVIAGTGAQADGRNRLRAVLVRPDSEGVSVSALPETPFAPEVPHAEITFVRAPGDPLSGDGYLDYLKPFRTIEDIHVLAAVFGWLTGVGRASDWPRSVLESLLARVAAVRGIEGDDPRSPGVHIALTGIFAGVEQLSSELEPWWEQVDPVLRRRWERDRPLLGVAGKVRAKRADAAWRTVGGG
ncbi:acyl-CoA dehydrogenase family protein [Nocardia donostiensis]|uniref:Acyl-CoA dehydrogenase n=1 Tax=Nocardia donostiensis TaxID=1538463 RepID=A0A1V2THT7_9NOCA|nr:acyl-CoA dehydrogenase family protein [Nocardia donostiensis]ONM49087.1 acyl-CoA dehydrogenase [Nocardia donostiensis]OQS14105.1 acyl-CoA dehydrogenase [Nocardia donostiensis]OQS19734.1 acyl-CoA dehydrogenase [Nocardia donostiensis]